MNIKTIPLSQLEADLRGTLSECADSGQALLVELPDQRLIAIQPLASAADDELTSELLGSNAAFQALVAQIEGAPAQALRGRFRGLTRHGGKAALDAVTRAQEDS